MSAEVDWKQPHNSEDCLYELCRYCKCCAHGSTQKDGCPVDEAPREMRCPDTYCGCES